MFGILLQHTCTQAHAVFPEYAPALLTLIYGGIGILSYGTYRLKYTQFTTGLLVLLALLTGMSRYAVSRYLPEYHISHLVNDELVTIQGVLDKPVRQIGRRRYLEVRVNTVEKNTVLYHTAGKIRITILEEPLPDDEPKPFLYGDVITTRLRLRQPRNFSDFDYREYLRRRGIYLIGVLRYDYYIIHHSLRQGNPLLRWIFQCQVNIQTFLDRFSDAADTSSRQAIEIIKAMTLGTSYQLSEEVKEQFRQAGLYHFLVVSGIHISVLTWVFHKFANILTLPFRFRSPFLAGLLLFYAGITGFHFPVLRAVIMAFVFYAALMCSRISNPLYSLAFTVGILLFLFPSALFEISFQLTIAATASILLFFRFLLRQPGGERFVALPKIIRIPASIVLTTFGALLGVAPLLVYYFGDFSPYSFISNPLAFPIVSVLLPGSLAANFLSLLFGQTGALGDWLSSLLAVNVFLANMFLEVSSWFPAAGLHFPRPTWLSLIMYYLSVGSVLGFARIPKWKTEDGYDR